MRAAARFVAPGLCLLALAAWAVTGQDSRSAAQGHARESAGQATDATAQPSTNGPNDRVKPWDGSRTTPVHLIPLKDENDAPIIPTEARPMPYSARFTCGPCHAYATIRGGLHFNTMAPQAAGRPGEPWIWLDPATGTVLPLSYKKWPGSWDPKALGLSAWDFTQLFGRHFPGGGPAEPSDDEVLSEPDARWNVSGKAEINCLACHNASNRQDHGEWAKQILRQNLRWAATAAGGVGEVGGMASRLWNTWSYVDGPNLDDHEWAVAPFVTYRTVDFDGKHRYFFDLDYRPADARCLACHSVSTTGEVRAHGQPDVHSAAGLKCADCHRNDLGHGMIRGYEGEAADTGNPAAESFTCRGCHLGRDQTGKRLVRPGRMGAPYPKHTGIPLVHFKTLECAVCHSGPRPAKEPSRVRTSRANRLGIHGVAQWFTETPAVLEPVFVKNADGKIGPRRLVWPAFWGRLDGKDVVPLRPEAVQNAAGKVLGPEASIAQTLVALYQACAEDEMPVLASGKSVFEANVDGGLDASVRPSGPEAREASWELRQGGSLVPLIPDFDPASPDKDPDIEGRILSYLQALSLRADSPGKAPEGFEGLPGAGWLVEGQLRPLASPFEVRTVTAKAGTEQTLTEEQVTLILQALAETGGQAAAPASEGREDPPPGPFVYISGGRLFKLDGRGRLVSEAHEAAEPVTWPLAHDVRPVQQSLGWNGCGDCHSAGSKFFFSSVKGTGPLLTASTGSKSATSLMGIGGLFQRTFGLTFAVRPLSKIVLALAILITGALLVVAFLVVIGRLAGLIEKRQ
jgi:hypothetical protein